jgi:hypothetical protein
MDEDIDEENLENEISYNEEEDSKYKDDNWFDSWYEMNMD